MNFSDTQIAVSDEVNANVSDVIDYLIECIYLGFLATNEILRRQRFAFRVFQRDVEIGETFYQFVDAIKNTNQVDSMRVLEIDLPPRLLVLVG